jgi:hypothetical protein
MRKLLAQSQQDNIRNELFQTLQGKPFWIWQVEEHKQEDIRTNGDCCFNHIIGLPQKDGIDKPMYDYEQLIFDSLVNLINTKHLWIKKVGSLDLFLQSINSNTAWLGQRSKQWHSQATSLTLDRMVGYLQ